MAMVASSSTSDSASTSANNNSFCDIFINHRGPDVKKTFASYLYHRLHSHGLKVFLDQDELQQGDCINSQIEGAIGSASVHVAIFSARYAESTWCLNELVSMLKTEKPIIPVFYGVKPAELRWTEGTDGVYAQALQKLQEKTKKAKYDPQTQTQQDTLRHDSETVEQWRDALSSVAGISGFELEACNGDEGKLLQKVVDSVLRKVKKTPALNVAKYPTGLSKKVEDFENKVDFNDIFSYICDLQHFNDSFRPGWIICLRTLTTQGLLDLKPHLRSFSNSLPAQTTLAVREMDFELLFDPHPPMPLVLPPSWPSY